LQESLLARLRLISASSFPNICHLPPIPSGKGVADPIGPFIRMAEIEGKKMVPRGEARTTDTRIFMVAGARNRRYLHLGFARIKVINA